MNLSVKVFTFTFVISALTLFAVAFHTIERITMILVDNALARVEENVLENSRILKSEVETATANLRVFATLSAVRNSLTASPDSVSLRELQKVFARVLENNPTYVQVRLIAASGDGPEIVRVDRIEDVIVIRQSYELQDKGSRYYVKDTLSMKPGETFISHIDLNREFGVIVEPRQPVFRVATPVFDGTGRRSLGVLVINVDFAKLAQGFRQQDELGFPVMTNNAGEYLHHPNAGKTFAWEFDQTENLPEDFGIIDQWAEWIAKPQNPKKLSLTTDDHIISLQQMQVVSSHSKHFHRDWVIGAVLSRDAINAIGASLREHLYITLAATSMFLALALGLAAAWLMRPVVELTGKANAIAKGEDGVEISIHSSDEVGVLANALDQMLHSLKAMAKNEEMASMGRMSVMIAHDLRNALSTVKMNLQILMTSSQDSDAQVQIEIALGQVQHMENILRDVMSFTRPDRMLLEWQDTCNMLDTCVAAVLPTAHTHDIEIEKDYAAGLPMIYCDRTKVLQAVQNFLHNAIQAVSEDRVGDTVLVSAHVEYEAGVGSIAIRVLDSGPGIPDEIAADLFEPFITTRAKGTGLGLAIVRRIAENHNAQVWARNREKDSGAEFGLRLPIEGPPAKGVNN